MQDDSFQDKLQQLIGKLQDLPGVDKEGLAQAGEKARQAHDQVGSTISAIKDSADHLRIAVKYLIFDLEATRRENEYLRKLLAAQDEAD
ncbi:MAG: hypothetical protein ACF8NJ_00195 [Phycisphaerales bacterium JB038]